MKLRNKQTGRIVDVPDSGEPPEPEVYISLTEEGNVRVREVRWRRLTEEEVVERAAKSEAESEIRHSFWWLMVPALVMFAGAMWLLHMIVKALRG